MILIRRNYQKGIYEAKFTAEDAVRVKELFGTNVLPTPYFLSNKSGDVRTIIANLNKDTLVDLE